MNSSSVSMPAIVLANDPTFALANKDTMHFNDGRLAGSMFSSIQSSQGSPAAYFQSSGHHSRTSVLAASLTRSSDTVSLPTSPDAFHISSPAPPRESPASDARLFFTANDQKYEVYPPPQRYYEDQKPSFTHHDPKLTRRQEVMGQYFCYAGMFPHMFPDGIDRLVRYPECTWGESCIYKKQFGKPCIPRHRWNMEYNEELAKVHEFLGNKEITIQNYLREIHGP